MEIARGLEAEHPETLWALFSSLSSAQVSGEGERF